MKNMTLKEAIEIFEKKLSTGDYIDSVHKIKLMTSKDMMKKLLNEKK